MINTVYFLLYVESKKQNKWKNKTKTIIDKENKLVVTAGDSTRGRGEIGDGT